MSQRGRGLLLFGAGLLLAWGVQYTVAVDLYVQLILMYIGINIILTASLNLINGYLGEFSVGHAGFMAIGAYTASLVTVTLIPTGDPLWRFPLAVMLGGLAAAVAGMLVAIPSFRTRGDYLAIVTLAFLMIVKSVVDNLEVLGGPRGFLGMEKLTTLPWVVFWTGLTLWLIRNFVYSKYGRGVLAVREDEIAAEQMGVDTRRVKVFAFALSSFFAGVAGGLFAHLLQFINPASFNIIKSTDILIMVYLGGVGSLTGSVLGATAYTLLLEVLRPLGVWRMVLLPLLLVLLMLFRPRGICGWREWRPLLPRRDQAGATEEHP